MRVASGLWQPKRMGGFQKQGDAATFAPQGAVFGLLKGEPQG